MAILTVWSDLHKTLAQLHRLQQVLQPPQAS